MAWLYQSTLCHQNHFLSNPLPRYQLVLLPLSRLTKVKTNLVAGATANREIRGIAGGRWFTRSWVGDKESELATAAVNAAAAAAILKANFETDKRAALSSTTAHTPELPSGINTASDTCEGCGQTEVAKSQPGASAVTSRAASIVSDVAPHAPRPPTKNADHVSWPCL